MKILILTFASALALNGCGGTPDEPDGRRLGIVSPTPTYSPGAPPEQIRGDWPTAEMEIGAYDQDEALDRRLGRAIGPQSADDGLPP